ncbi:hypothetical protein M0804_001264 [Polistes exclamans]|nr:hypothetical protein M0804_001264 [Polistes exclamans]
MAASVSPISAFMRTLYFTDSRWSGWVLEREVGRVSDSGMGRVVVRVGGKGRSMAYPAWGSLQPHATLEPSISSKIYGFLVQRLLGQVHTAQYHVVRCWWCPLSRRPCCRPAGVYAQFALVH